MSPSLQQSLKEQLHCKARCAIGMLSDRLSFKALSPFFEDGVSNALNEVDAAMLTNVAMQ